MKNTTFKLIKTALKSDHTVNPECIGPIIDRINAMCQVGNVSTGNVSPKLLRRTEVAARLSMSLRTVDSLAHQGLLKKLKFPGRKRACGFLESDVVRLLSM